MPLPRRPRRRFRPTPTPVAVNTFDPSAAGGRTVIKWYVGLGTGGDPKQIDVQKAVVDSFNKSQSNIYLTLQIVDNDFLAPLVYLVGHEELWPISVGMSYFTGQYTHLPQLIQATALMALAVPVMIFLLAQRVFVQGVVVTEK